jgi:hypothetical protein
MYTDMILYLTNRRSSLGAFRMHIYLRSPSECDSHDYHNEAFLVLIPMYICFSHSRQLPNQRCLPLTGHDKQYPYVPFNCEPSRLQRPVPTTSASVAYPSYHESLRTPSTVLLTISAVALPPPLFQCRGESTSSH